MSEKAPAFGGFLKGCFWACKKQCLALPKAVSCIVKSSVLHDHAEMTGKRTLRVQMRQANRHEGVGRKSF